MTLFLELHFNWESLTSMTYGLLKLAAEKWAEEVMEKNHKRGHSMLCTISGLFFQSSGFFGWWKIFSSYTGLASLSMYLCQVYKKQLQTWLNERITLLSVFQKVLQFTPCPIEQGLLLKSPWIYVRKDNIWTTQCKQLWLCMWAGTHMCTHSPLDSY